MTTVGVGTISIEPDFSQFGRRLEAGVTRAIDGAGDKARKGLGAAFADAASSAGQSLNRVGSTMSRSVTLPVVAGFGLMTKAASDLEEQTNKTTVVFGKAGKEITDFTKNSAKGLGQSKRAALEFAGTFGNLFRAIGLTEQKSADMSKRLLTLTADLASFNNARPDEVFDALRAGLVGETEPLKRFGINLNDARLKAEALNLGLSNGKGVLDANAKAQAAFSLILKDTTLAQGDFARTSDSLANKTRTAKAELEDAAATLGSKLIPFALKAVQAGAGLIQWFNDLEPALQGAVLAGGALLAALGPIIKIAGNLAMAVGAVSKAMVFLATSTSLASVAAAGFGLAAAGIVAGVVAYKLSVNAMNAANDKFNDETAVAVNNAALFDGATKETAKNLKEQAVAAYIAGAALNTHTDVQKGAAIVGKTMADEQEKARVVLAKLADTTGVSRQRIVELANSMGINLGAMSEEAKEKLAGAIGEISRAVTPTERLASVQETLASETSTAAEAMDAFKEAVDAALGVVLDEREAAIKLAEKVSELGERLVSGEQGIAEAQERVAEAQERLNKARRGAAPDAEAAARAEQNLAEAHFAVEDAQSKLNDARNGTDAAAVRRAELGLADATLKVSEAQSTLNRTRTAPGGDPEAIAAATRDLAEANGELTTAQQNTGNAVGLGTARQRELNTALIGVVRAAQDEVDAITRSGQISTDAASQKAALVARLEEVKRKFPELTGPIDEYIAKIGTIPDTAKTTAVFDSKAAQAEIDKYASTVAALQKSFGGGLSAKLTPDALPKKHSGGLMEGRAREMPALLERGEFVLQKSAVDVLGVSTLDALNKMHAGGLVPGAVAPIAGRIDMDVEPLSAMASGPLAGGVTFGNINVTGVRDGEDAATLLPTRLRTELFLMGAG